jgi:hypothetical protein
MDKTALVCTLFLNCERTTCRTYDVGLIQRGCSAHSASLMLRPYGVSWGPTRHVRVRARHGTSFSATVA